MAPQFKGANSLAFCLLYGPVLTTIHDHWEDHSLDYRDFGGRVISLLFNTLSRFIITFLPRSNYLLISWLQSPSTVTLEPKKRKVMINLDNVLKSRDITLLTKVHIIEAMVFPVVTYSCESWTVKKAEH